MLEKINSPFKHLLIFAILYITVTLSIWNKYGFNPSSMVYFGKEFALKNPSLIPENAVLILGSGDDLGAGYDGQIFYFYSRVISNFSTEWPIGFDESYRAPRIGYPLLVAIFGVFGKYGNIAGMYIINILLMVFSYFALRDLSGKENSRFTIFYLLSPFSLGSYSVLVSDSVMCSLCILALFLFSREKYFLFFLIGGLSVITKEPALFFFFPLGFYHLMQRDWKKALLSASVLIIPILWHLYLRYKFPSWRASRLTDFILPLEGISTYLRLLFDSIGSKQGIASIARDFSRLPLLFMLVLGLILTFSGNIKNIRSWIFRGGLILTFFMILSAGHYHFWSVYENISRMFTVSIPLAIFLYTQDNQSKIIWYLYSTIFILVLFLVKIFLIQKALPYELWQAH